MALWLYGFMALWLYGGRESNVEISNFKLTWEQSHQLLLMIKTLYKWKKTAIRDTKRRRSLD